MFDTRNEMRGDLDIVMLLPTRHAARQFCHRMGRKISEKEARLAIARSKILLAKIKKRDAKDAMLFLCDGGYALVGIPAPLIMWSGWVIEAWRIVTILSHGNIEYERLVLRASEECVDAATYVCGDWFRTTIQVGLAVDGHFG